MNEKILIIEDEAAIRQILAEPLKSAGYGVVCAADGVEGLNAFRAQAADLIILDIMLPKLDGYRVCETIRRESRVPIILLTALDSEDAQIKGFDKLADDYITKPFSVRLVLLSFADYYEERRVCVAGKEVALTRLEFEILLLFMKNVGRVFTRNDLLNLAWGYDFVGGEKGVNFHIMNLRRKLNVGYIETVRGVGYKIAKD